MTVKVCAIVEGDGEVLALPKLLHRIWQWKTPDCPGMNLQMAFDRSRSFRKLCSDWITKTRLFCPAD